MPKLIRNIEIYLPLDFNDGRSIPDARFVGVQRELLTRFGGVTSTQRQFPLQGMWESKGRVYLDRVVVFSVMDVHQTTHMEIVAYLERLKGRLIKKFDQLDVLITLHELQAI